jgi:uncharacterized protein YeaO (DUF488 family)
MTRAPRTKAKMKAKSKTRPKAKTQPKAKAQPKAKTQPKARSGKGGAGTIAIKRAYDVLGPHDGLRILVDRLWPRGVSKSTLKLDAWPRELSPSTELRKWYGHDPERFAEFRKRYGEELATHKDQLAALRAMLKGKTATLLTATRALDLSHAIVLRDKLQDK